MNPEYQTDTVFIGGKWVAPATRNRIEVRSPSTEEIIGYAPAASPEDVDRAVEAARHCFETSAWPSLSYSERAVYLDRAADAIQAHADRLALVTAHESGLPYVTVAPAMIGRTVEQLRYCANLGRELRQEERRPGKRLAVTVRREPVGVVGIITPWNAPTPIAHFGLAAALLAGCAVVLKTAPETPLHGQILASIYSQIDLPPGVLNVLSADREASEALVRHPGVDKVSFTGSTATGRKIAALCGESLKRCNLELGGKSAAIVLEDATLDRILPGLLNSAIQNNCQACVGQTRILAPASRYDEIVDALSECMESVRIGDPFDSTTQMGPLISERQRDRVEGYIALGREEGAVMVRGGGRAAGLDRGWYLDLTVFRDAHNKMRIAREEIFGPVFVVIPFDDEDQAIAIANDSEYGLAGTVWTSDLERGFQVARRVRTGTVGVNAYGLEYSAPFGGYKASGIGRQLGPEGVSGFTELKAIYGEL